MYGQTNSKTAGLAVLNSWQIRNGSHDFFLQFSWVQTIHFGQTKFCTLIFWSIAGVKYVITEEATCPSIVPHLPISLLAVQTPG